MDPARTRADLGTLAATRVFFAHQSVGEDLVSGLAAWCQELSRPLHLCKPEAVVAQDGPFFAHARLGRNGDPLGKTDAFAAALDQGLAARVEIAVHKYCYVDVHATTDVGALFDAYRTAAQALARRHAHVRFIHVTVPLCTVEDGLKAWTKRLIGRPLDRVADNRSRHAFNSRLRETYGPGGALFDLAAVESGPLESRSDPSLWPGFARDEGHLNAKGAWHAAAAFAQTVARQSPPSGADRVSAYRMRE